MSVFPYQEQGQYASSFRSSENIPSLLQSAFPGQHPFEKVATQHSTSLSPLWTSLSCCSAAKGVQNHKPRNPNLVGLLFIRTKQKTRKQ